MINVPKNVLVCLYRLGILLLVAYLAYMRFGGWSLLPLLLI